MNDCARDSVLLFDANFNYMTQILSKNGVRAICCSRQGNLVLVTVEGQVQIFDKDGNIIDTFNLSGVSRCSLYLSTSSICCNSRDEIIIGDPMKNKIFIFSPKGHLLKSFDGRDDLKNNGYRCMEICIDYRDNIFVADHLRDRISVFTENGTLLQKIGTPCPRVRQLCILGRNLYVTCAEGVFVFGN